MICCVCRWGVVILSVSFPYIRGRFCVLVPKDAMLRLHYRKNKNILLSDELMVSFAKIQDGKPIPSLLVDVAFRRLQTPLFVRVPEKALCLAGSRNSFAHISAVRNLYLSIRWHIGCITSGNTVMALPYILR